MPTGRDGTGATARIAGDDERPSRQCRAALRWREGGRGDHGHRVRSGGWDIAVHRWPPASLQLQGGALAIRPGGRAGVVRAAREVGEGDFLSSTYRRDHHRPPIGVPGGEPNPSLYVKEDIAGRDRLRHAAGGADPPAAAGLTRRRAARSGRRRRALPAWSGRRASRGCSGHDRERW